MRVFVWNSVSNAGGRYGVVLLPNNKEQLFVIKATMPQDAGHLLLEDHISHSPPPPPSRIPIHKLFPKITTGLT